MTAACSNASDTMTCTPKDIHRSCDHPSTSLLTHRGQIVVHWEVRSSDLLKEPGKIKHIPNQFRKIKKASYNKISKPWKGSPSPSVRGSVRFASPFSLTFHRLARAEASCSLSALVCSRSRPTSSSGANRCRAATKVRVRSKKASTPQIELTDSQTKS